MIYKWKNRCFVTLFLLTHWIRASIRSSGRSSPDKHLRTIKQTCIKFSDFFSSITYTRNFNISRATSARWGNGTGTHKMRLRWYSHTFFDLIEGRPKESATRSIINQGISRLKPNQSANILLRPLFPPICSGLNIYSPLIYISSTLKPSLLAKAKNMRPMITIDIWGAAKNAKGIIILSALSTSATLQVLCPNATNFRISMSGSSPNRLTLLWWIFERFCKMLSWTASEGCMDLCRNRAHINWCCWITSANQ